MLPLPVTVSAALLGIYFLWRRGRRARRPLPPGPWPLPIVGNLFDMPRSNVWETFSKWNNIYGEVVYLRILGRPIIFLNSVKATTDLLEKRGLLYSDRPQFPLMNLAGHQWNFGFMSYGKEWQSLRRTFTSQYNSMVALRSFYDAHRASVSTFLLNVMRDPKDVSNHLRLRSAQVMFDVSYGISVTSWDHQLIRTAEAVMDVVSLALSPSMWIINTISILNALPRWLGGAAVAAKVEKWQTDVQLLRNAPFKIVKESLANGTARPSFTASLLRESWASSDDPTVNEGLIRDTAAIALGAAYETTFAAGEVFILMMALNEDVQRLAQAEIDAVVGTDRLPDFIDRERLPYVTAVMKEVLRFHSPAPTGIPHELTEDDWYEGMFLPAGSMVMGNIWQILHDPLTYPDPFKFDPNRFISDGQLDCKTNDPSRFVFGFGRRVCPGRLFTEDSLWLTFAQFLAIFSISVPKNRPTKPLFSTGAISRPLPFDHMIVPRSPTAQKLLTHLQDA
ncbi:cytochrome P450 [Mycena filopes]|nr:cytochrome P450 [Mycena filopes]